MSVGVQLLWVALGGALGAMSRFGLSNAVNSRMADANIPYGTFVVNVLGSALMAVFFVLVVENKALSEWYKPFVMSGFLGAFTTFSTFSMEAVLLLQQQAVAPALGYVLANVCVSILAFSAALYVMRLVN